MVFFLDNLQTVNSIPHIRSFHFLAYGTVQCYVFLSFLPPLANFGLTAPIPVDIRVLGVETSLRTKLFKGARLQDKTHSTLILRIFTTSFLPYFSSSSSQLAFFSQPLFLSSFTFRNNIPPNLSSSIIDSLIM